MGTITTRTLKDGSKTYRAGIVIKQPGVGRHRESLTFDKITKAKAWIKLREEQLKEPEDHTWWRGTSPRPIVAGQGPEVSGFGLSCPRVEDRGTGLVHEELGGSLQVGHQRVMDRAKLEGGTADPVGQGGSVELHALATVDLGLAIERQVICVFADQHMRHRRLGGHTARDQPRWRGRLDDPIRARAAGIFGTAGDDDPELGGHDIQPFRDIFPDAVQAAAANTGHRLHQACPPTGFCRPSISDMRSAGLCWARGLSQNRMPSTSGPFISCLTASKADIDPHHPGWHGSMFTFRGGQA